MKKLTFLLSILLVSLSVFADIGPVGRSFFQTIDGTAVTGSREQWYIYVKNTSGGSVNDGSVFVLETTEDDGYSVTTSTTAGSIPVCVLQKRDGSACADDEVCRCQTYGYSNDVVFDSTNGNGTVGKMAYISEDTAGAVEGEASPAATDYPIGMFYDTTSSSGDVELFLLLR